MIEALSLIGSMLLIMWACATHQQRFACPRGWWLPEGVRDTGEFTCRPAPVGVEFRNQRGVLVDRSVQPAGALQDRVWCTGGSIPVQGDDGRTVSCQARH